jgi:hypothetical protein
MRQCSASSDAALPSGGIVFLLARLLGLRAHGDGSGEAVAGRAAGRRGRRFVPGGALAGAEISFVAGIGQDGASGIFARPVTITGVAGSSRGASVGIGATGAGPALA